MVYCSMYLLGLLAYLTTMTTMIPGDEIPADGLWLDGSPIIIDESALTGESDPFTKNEEKPLLFAGSLVTDGKARMLVTAVGADTTGRGRGCRSCCCTIHT